MFDKNTLEQLKSYFEPLKKKYTLHLQTGKDNAYYQQAEEMLSELASTSPQIEFKHTEDNSFRIDLLVDGEPSGITFRGIPGGHEFTSLLLAILNHEGIGKNLPDEGVQGRIKRLNGPISLQTYVSLSCTNCPDVVQTLNVFAMLHPSLTHEMIDGAMFKHEAEQREIASVPTVIADGDVIHVGRGDMATLLNKLEEKYGSKELTEEDLKPKHFDVVVLGGGPAGASAAIYTARKGLKVALVAERIGGQVNETVGIENLISVPSTTGSELAANLRKHIDANEIELFQARTVKEVISEKDNKQVVTTSGETFVAPSLIVASGASWRKLRIPGEKEYTGNGVAYCAHCDGPFFKGKRVAVVGGGNSGMEAAIDLANICSHVTVIEFLDTLKADEVLQKKAKETPNIDIKLATASKEIIGDGKKVTSLVVEDRTSGEESTIELDGVFVQIGLAANTSFIKDIVKTNRAGEIEIDNHCRTSEDGIYAAGDCTTVPYKQIVIAMGEGAKAALTSFEAHLRR